MILVKDQVILTNWHPRNKKHLESKGYKYTHTGDPVSVKLEDMMQGSKCKVKVICDYCGKEFTKIYKDYFRNRKDHPTDCCSECHTKKAAETNLIKYGGDSPACSKKVIEKIRETARKRYGVDWPSKTEECQKKVVQINLERFGVARVSQNKEIKDKIIKTNIKKFGGPSSLCDSRVRQKALRTMLKNGNVPISQSEQDLIDRLKIIYGTKNCTQQYILDRISFDCLLVINDIKIDVEYDGIYWHQDTHKDLRRDFFTMKNGFKVLRFRCKKGVPDDDKIKESVCYLVNNEHNRLVVDI